jgi:hypothetical protein
MRLLLALAFILLTTTAFPQGTDYYRSVIHTASAAKYIIPDQEIGDAWKGRGFNDDAWLTGTNGIGYGDGDDATKVAPGTQSVYIRYTFNLADTSILRQWILDMDYDDGFAAYLNGTEIASGNISKPYAWDMTLDRDHEAALYQGLLPERRILAKEEVTPLITTGENVLAVEIHNISSASSDLSLWAFLHINFTSAQAGYHDPEPWFEPPVALYSHLPIVKINTNGAQIPNEPKIPAWMEIIYTEGDTSSQYDSPNVYSGHIAIEQRGESSSGFPKKQYSLETRTDSGTNNNVPLLGMPAENDWVLYAPYSDKSLMKNVLTYILSRQMGEAAPRTRYVEVLLNGDYQGIYVLIEKIKRDDNRINIATLLPQDTEGNELTGGYVIRNDKTTDMAAYEYWRGPSNRPYGLQSLYMYYDPKYEELVYEQRRYIVDFTKLFEETLIKSSFRDSINGYRKYTDIFSYMHMMFINELSMNVDCYHFSTYFYKEKDSDGGKFFSGPVWDYNLAWGNVNYGDVEVDDGFIYTRGGRMFHWRRMMEDPWYANVALSRWDDLRENVLSWQNIEHIIDSCVTHMGPAIDRNFEKWPTLGTYVWANIEWPDTYEGEVALLKNFIIERLPWLDSQWSGIGTGIVDYPPHLTCKPDQYMAPNAGDLYFAADGALDPEFAWDDFDIDSITNNINGDWTLDGVTIPDGTNITWTITDSKGQQASCSFNVYVDANSVFDEKLERYALNMYPNPARDQFTVEGNFPISEIMVQTMDGKTVQHIFAEGEHRIEISTSAYRSGAYIVTVKAKNGYRKSMLQLIN